jgi:hypothetical protein
MTAIVAAVATILYFIESEFLSLVGGACGPNACAMAMSWADQKYIGTRPTYLRFAAIGGCDGNGVSTGSQLVHGLTASGYKVERGAASDWLGFLKSRLAQPAAVVVELSQAHNLRDFLTGAGMDAGPGLRFHYITAFIYHPGGYSAHAGRELPEGFFCADGDSDATNPVVAGHRTRVVAGHTLVFYTLATLAAAAPCDLIAVFPRFVVEPAQTPLPNGWTDDGTTLRGGNGVAVVKGFRDYVTKALIAGTWRGGFAYEPEWGDATSSRQLFGAALLEWTPQHGVYEGTMADALALAAHLREGKAA